MQFVGRRDFGKHDRRARATIEIGRRSEALPKVVVCVSKGPAGEYDLQPACLGPNHPARLPPIGPGALLSSQRVHKKLGLLTSRPRALHMAEPEEAPVEAKAPNRPGQYAM